MNPTDLPNAFRLDDRLGLTRLNVSTPRAEAELFLHGAHLTRFGPRDEEPVLFLSRHAEFAEDKAIRGGVPIIFPWFGPHPTDPNAPAHGTVRRAEWKLTDASQTDDVAALQLQLDGEAWSLTYRVTVGATLTMELQTRNVGDAPFEFEHALHTYFVVGDVREVMLLGLDNAEYLDKTQKMTRFRQDGDVRFSGETDRTYVNTAETCTVIDPVLQRRIVVAKSGSSSTVVWNPWIDKAREMKDFGDDEWTKMLCVESGNIGENRVTLQPDESHVLRVDISVAREARA